MPPRRDTPTPPVSPDVWRTPNPGDRPTHAPRWFYPVLGACALLVTLAVLAVAAAAVVRLRFMRISDAVTLDVWQRAACSADNCVRVSRTVIPTEEALHRGQDYPAGTSRPALP